MNIFVSTWSLLAGGLLFSLPMIHLRVKEHTELEEETLYVQIFPWNSKTTLIINHRPCLGLVWTTQVA